MQDFLTGVFSSSFYIGSMLNLSVLLTIAGLGNCLSIKAGFMNLGGEGQIYLGGFAAAVCLNAFRFLPPPLNLFFSLIISMSICGLMAWICAFLKWHKNAEVLLTTFLCSAAVIPIIDWLIQGPFRTQTGNLLATPQIFPELRLASILPPSTLNLSIIAVPFLCMAVSLALEKTQFGKELLLFGKAREFALYSGFSYKKTLYFSVTASGMLHGLCGFIAVLGTYYSCPQGFYTGMGWNALSAALFCNSNSKFIFIPAVLLSWLYTSADRYSLLNNTGYDISGLLQGAVVFIVSAVFLTKKLRFKKAVKKA